VFGGKGWALQTRKCGGRGDVEAELGCELGVDVAWGLADGVFKDVMGWVGGLCLDADLVCGAMIDIR
jgi:hypothetical protein